MNTHPLFYFLPNNTRIITKRKMTTLKKLICITDAVLIKSGKKGRYVLLYKNFTYTRRSKSKKGIVWKCSLGKQENCDVTVTTNDNLDVVLKKGTHSHQQSDVQSKHVYFTV